MDTFTHGLAGLLLGRAGARDDARSTGLACGLAAMFPDADAFFIPGGFRSPGSSLAYLEFHRGPTHSFLLAPLFAAAIAGMAKLLRRRVRFQTFWLASLGGIVSHILFDWITSYGTMFFSPLSWKRYALDWVFILDPIFTGILVLFLLLSSFRRGLASRRIAVTGSLLLFSYIGLCAVMHSRALSSARKLFPNSAETDLAALPQPFSPFRWVLFGSSAGSIDAAYVDVGPSAPDAALDAGRAVPRTFWEAVRTLSVSYARPERARIVEFPRRETEFAVARAEKFDDVAVWSRFARFRVAKVEPASGGNTRVTFTDLRFRGPWRRTAFEYEAVVSPEGKRIASGFVRLFILSKTVRR